MKAPNIKIPPQLFAYGLITIIVIWVLYLVMRRIGLIKGRQEKLLDKEERKEKEQLKKEAQILQDSEYFNPLLYKNTNYGYAVLMPQDVVKKWAQDIQKSFGWFNDDEERIYSVFRNLPNKITLSQLSDAYAQIYKSDLLGDLVYYLNTEELAFIYKIIAKLPIGGTK